MSAADSVVYFHRTERGWCLDIGDRRCGTYFPAYGDLIAWAQRAGHLTPRIAPRTMPEAGTHA